MKEANYSCMQGMERLLVSIVGAYNPFGKEDLIFTAVHGNPLGMGAKVSWRMPLKAVLAFRPPTVWHGKGTLCTPCA